MSQSLIMRDYSIEFTEAEKAIAVKVLTQSLRGVDDENHRRWTGFLRRMLRMEMGEIAKVATEIPRSGPFHRFHMAMEQAVFRGQERFTQEKRFRDWLKIGAGHVEWVPGAKGGIVPLPKSISYAELEEAEMREVHVAMLAFLRGPHAAPYLWNHLDPEEAGRMLESILEGFEK